FKFDQFINPDLVTPAEACKKKSDAAKDLGGSSREAAEVGSGAPVEVAVDQDSRSRHRRLRCRANVSSAVKIR
ncbi:hypothetical protein AB0N17_46425, partial [Streptomyces sp. NPDC051133]|uniref:hypothetical protein n=1 Tax=Streptomyces sp. NPDC051133 TaxID=3155521 RepID=UPI00343B5327